MQKVITGNNMDVLPTLTKYKFDLIFADPPYIGVDKGYRSYFMDWFPLAKQLLKTNGTIIITVGVARRFLMDIDNLETPTDIYIYLKNGSGKITYWKDTPSFNWEVILDYHYSKDRYIDKNICSTGIFKNYKWTNQFMGKREASWHPTPKHIDFMVDIVNMFCPVNGLVLDPFLGSGTTLVACKKTGRNGVGIELNDKWSVLCDERIKNTSSTPTIDSFLTI